MNCQDIVRILDDGNIGTLSATERDEGEAHALSCRHCARRWLAHTRMADLPIPPMPSELAAQVQTLVAARARGNVLRFASRRMSVLAGGFVVLAAAAMLGLWLNSASPDPGAIRAAVPVKAVATPPVETSPQVQSQAEPQAAPKQQPAALPPGSFTVRVPELSITGNDQAGAALTQKFRDRVIDKLGRVPGVVLVDPEAAGDFEVRISFSGTAPSSGVMAEVDAERPAIFAAHDAAIESVSTLHPDDQEAKRLELEILDALRSTSATIRQNPSLVDLLGGGFPRPVILSETLPSAIRGPDRLESAANDVVWNLRTKVFPISPMLEPELMAKVGDSGRSFAERRHAFAALLSIALRRGKLPAVDTAVIRAGAEFALTAADSSRDVENLWNALALTRNPELVPYLIRGLDSAPTDMRLHLIKMLASVFADDPRARAALEAASLQNSETIVRMAAVRESQDESGWNEYVVATLNDTSLSDLQRLQPFADMALDDDTFFTPGRKSSGFQLDDKAARELGMLIQRVVRIPDFNSRFPTAEINMANSALRVLSMMETPAASDVIVELLRATDRPGLFLQLPALTLARKQFPNDPKVRAAIEELASRTDAGWPATQAKLVLAEGSREKFDEVMEEIRKENLRRNGSQSSPQ